MKKAISTFLTLIITLFIVNAQKVIDTTAIVAGTAKITGRIILPIGIKKDSISININVPSPISGEYIKYKAFVDQSGKFSFDVELETTISLAGLNTSLKPEKSLIVKLTSDRVTNIEISYNPDYNIKNISIIPVMNQSDMTRGFEVIEEMIEYRPDRASKPWYNKSTDDFLNHAKAAISEKLEIINNDSLLSKELKEVLSKHFRLMIYVDHVFPYETEMARNYKDTSGDKIGKPIIQKIDKFYFRFLKDFDLNDPQYLQFFMFSEFQKAILQNENLGIPVIGESDIPSWLASVKVILSDLVGFNSGLYYDILAANAYARQLTEEVKPLTEKQKQNIISYWGNGEIAKILFRKNQKVAELDKFKSLVVINDVSTVPADKVIETIISKHKDKVILIDLWATWCGPCLEAMKDFSSTKTEFHDKDVVFVYLTNGSSPRKLWEEKIKGIGSEHYYLDKKQWEYVMDQFEFEYIPSYLLYTKKGVLANKFSAFPGNEKVRKLINGLL